MSRIMGKDGLIVLAFALLSYLVVLGASVMAYKVHQPLLLSNYVRESLVYALSKYVWAFGIWIVLGIVYAYLKCGGYETNLDQTEPNSEIREGRSLGSLVKYCLCILYRERVLVWCLLITFMFIHCHFIINRITQQHEQLSYSFKHGKTKPPKPSPSPISWPGWQYYYSDDYYTQTKSRLEHSRAKLMELGEYEAMLLALKNLNQGIYSVRSWLANHRLGYELLRVCGGFVGGVGVGVLWAVWGCGRGLGGGCYRGVVFGVLVLFWVMVPVFVMLSESLHSLILFNSHPICMPTPNSGVVAIKIPSASAAHITNLNFTLIEDPNKIYSNICLTMQKYFQMPRETDQLLVSYVINFVGVGLGVVFLLEVFWVWGSMGIGRWMERSLGGAGRYQSVGEAQ